MVVEGLRGIPWFFQNFPELSHFLHLGGGEGSLDPILLPKSLRVNLSYDPVCPFCRLVGLLDGWSVSHNFCHNFQLKGREVAKGQIKVSSKGRLFRSSFRNPLFIRLLSFAIQSSFTCLGFQLQLTRAQIIYYIFFSDIIASANHKNHQQRSEDLQGVH